MNVLIKAVSTIILILVLMLSVLSNFNIATIVIIVFAFAFYFWRLMPKNNFFKWLKKLIIAGAVFFAVGIGFVAACGYSTSTLDEDAVIVLGCAVHGYTPSNSLIMRLNKCIEYTQINKAAVIVVSGGQGPQEKISEAEAMADYLVANGVDSNRILIENKATSTNENFINSKKILDEHFQGNSYKTCFITNHFHTYRAGELARLNGLDTSCYSAKTPATAMLMCYVREVMAVVKLWLFKA